MKTFLADPFVWLTIGGITFLLILWIVRRVFNHIYIKKLNSAVFKTTHEHCLQCSPICVRYNFLTCDVSRNMRRECRRSGFMKGIKTGKNRGNK